VCPRSDVAERRNREAALAILEWLEARVAIDQTLAREIRRLL
jgi:hypothetical protein